MKSKGYIAITTTLIFSLIAILVAIVSNSFSFLSRANKLEVLNKDTSYQTAWSCLEIAVLKLGENYNYAGSENFNVSGYTCTIFPIEAASTNKIIKAQSIVSEATTNLKLTVDSTLHHISIEELQKL